MVNLYNLLHVYIGSCIIIITINCMYIVMIPTYTDIAFALVIQNYKGLAIILEWLSIAKYYNVYV